MLGLKSAVDDTNDLVSILTLREQDHVNWLNNLEKSIEENTPYRWKF